MQDNPKPMAKKTVTEILKSSNFGSRSAEDESDFIEEYFVRTDQWERVRSGDIDIIYGAKGSGKSAIYNLILKNSDELFDDGVLLISGEKPQGSPVFNSVMDSPPETDEEFSNLWKLYSLALLGDALREYEIKNENATVVVDALGEAGLIPEEPSLKKTLKYVFDYVRNITKTVEGVEGSVSVDANSMLQTFGGRILFREPTSQQAAFGAVSVEELLERADRAFKAADIQCWILLDRLDVAFSGDEEVEARALRGLFKCYLDTRAQKSIGLKVFLRDDIWDRITEAGFREASHIERSITISWREDDLLQLFVRRIASNPDIVAFAGKRKEVALSSQEEMSKFYYSIFPDQVDTGSNKPSSFNWILGRTMDSHGEAAPREIIHFLNCMRDEQLSRIEGGTARMPEGRLFEQATFKAALPEVSKVRLEQTLYAEYPQHKPFIEKLREQKGVQTLPNIQNLWDQSLGECIHRLEHLEKIGFLKKQKDDTWRIAFLYWPALSIIQGSSD